MAERPAGLPVRAPELVLIPKPTRPAQLAVRVGQQTGEEEQRSRRHCDDDRRQHSKYNAELASNVPVYFLSRFSNQ